MHFYPQFINVFILDVNECEMNSSSCSPNEECVNTEGSHKCLIICKKGYVRSEDELYCKGKNWVCCFYFRISYSKRFNVTMSVCFQKLSMKLCVLVVLNDFSLAKVRLENGIKNCAWKGKLCRNNVFCVLSSVNVMFTLQFFFTDIDECALKIHNCSHFCNNNIGNYSCSCRNGYNLVDKYECLGTVSYFLFLNLFIIFLVLISFTHFFANKSYWESYLNFNEY